MDEPGAWVDLFDGLGEKSYAVICLHVALAIAIGSEEKFISGGPDNFLKDLGHFLIALIRQTAVSDELRVI
jgi:hypothetical protein